MSNSNPKVVSLVDCLGHRSEGWLYSQLCAPRRHDVHVVTDSYINRGEYPFRSVVQCCSLARRLRRKLQRLVAASGEHWMAENRDRIRKILFEQAPVVIQAHFGWTGFHATEFLRFGRTPFLIWLYGSDVFRRGPCRDQWLPQMFQADVHFACTSNALKEEAVRLGCRPARITVIYPGIDISGIQPGRTVLRDDKIRVLTVGRLVDVKDPIGLTKVAAILKRSCLQFDWEVLGSGPLFSEMQAAIAAEGVSECMHLRGEVRNADVLEALSRSDLFVHNAVLTSDGAREAFGFVLAEASASGLPIVASGIGGIPEIVIHGETGFLVPPGDQKGMAQSVLALVGDPVLRARLGAGGRARAIRRFGIERLGTELDSLYQALVRK